jgi:trans-2,3-dihydro-3-hydroxyanthranilate isomerase
MVRSDFSHVSPPVRTLRFTTCDVFTETPLTGNPLAVVFGAEGLSDETLLAITREFNYSETTFVFAPETPGTTRRVRIFTPGGEVPFAGHPTLGTAHVLVATGMVRANADDGGTAVLNLVLGENVGPVPVRVWCENGVPTHAQLTTAQRPEERAEGVPPRAALAEVLALQPEDFVGGAHAPMGVSCGLPFLVVPLASVDAVRRARVRQDAWEAHLRGRWATEPLVFALVRDDADREDLPVSLRTVDIRARVFVPGLSVPEDPATGSANACLAGYLAARTPRDGTLRWRVAQGVEMGRPSRLELEADKQGGVITAVRVAGASVVVSEGTMRLPAAGH